MLSFVNKGYYYRAGRHTFMYKYNNNLIINKNSGAEIIQDNEVVVYVLNRV